MMLTQKNTNQTKDLLYLTAQYWHNPLKSSPNVTCHAILFVLISISVWMFGGKRVEVNGVVEGGRWIRITGLTSAAGQKLNGKIGQVLNENPNQDGRIQVKIDGDASRGKLIKVTNITDIPRDELVQTCRLAARGEDTDCHPHKVLLFPKDHSMFSTCNPKGDSPVMALCGLPLAIKRVNAYKDLSRSGQWAMDNQRATYLMINPMSGFAPYEWQTYVGPVLVYRPGGLDLNFYDMVCINTYFYEIIDSYAEEPGTFNPMNWVNPAYFQRIVRFEKANLFPDGNGNLNII